MKYDDLTDWDKELIKSNAIRDFVDTKSNATEAMIKSVLSAIHAMGYNLVKDETREATWTHGPKKSWYAVQPPKRYK